VTTYNWSGLLQRRIAIMIALLTVLPVSCIAGQFDHGGFTWLAGFAGLLAALTWIRAWKCPRCNERYAGRSTFPYVRPFRQECLQCGLPGFTPTAEEAPPPIERAPPPIVVKKKKRLLSDWRARVTLVFAIPFLWITTCRLPAGQHVRTDTGQDIEVLGIGQHVNITSAGQTRSIVVSYYTPKDSAVSSESLLRMALPTIGATGDSTVVLNQLRGDWWARAFGLRLSYVRSFTLNADGSWTPR
jgi:hypothetical protein